MHVRRHGAGDLGRAAAGGLRAASAARRCGRCGWRRGAFGPGLPHADLWLSPDHAVYVNEVLIPVRYLVNGSTIAQVKVDSVTYHHIELAEHDVLLAEGLPAESFLDMKDGSNYGKAGPMQLYPDFTARMWEAFGCAPLIVTGPELAAARALVAGFATDPAGRLIGTFSTHRSNPAIQARNPAPAALGLTRRFGQSDPAIGAVD